MKTSSRRQMIGVGILAVALVMLAGVRPVHGGVLRTWSIDGAGTWDDDATPANWGGSAVATNSDKALINRTNGATVDYASTNFSGANRLLATGSSSGNAALTLGGSGGINTLQIGSGDTLQVDAPGYEWGGIRIDNGGRLDISGGTVEDVTSTQYPDFIVNDGGSVTLSGTGVLKLPGVRCSAKLADTAGHSASLTVSGSGQFTCEDTSGSSGSEFYSRAGNSTVSVSDSGLLRVGRDLRVGTTGGTHSWTISGGALQRAGAKNAGWYLGNSNGIGSVTVTQTGGSFSNENHTTYLRGTARYTMSGSAYMNSVELRVDGTLIQSNGYLNIGGEIYVGNTAGATGAYAATAGNLYTKGLHIADVADATGTVTLDAGVTYTNNSITGSFPRNIAIGATNGAGTGTFEIKGLSGISDGGGGGFAYGQINQTGVLKGYGTLSGYGYLQVNGRVIADGYGSDRTLNLSGCPHPTNTVENSTNQGFYAVNGGKLTLANVAVAAGSTTVNWGESAGDTDIDLVNSARIAFTGATSGNLSGSLLATDRTDVPTGLRKPLSAYTLTYSAAFSSAVVTFRYDAVKAAALGAGDESGLCVYQWDGVSKWVDITDTSDTANKRITAKPIAQANFSRMVAVAASRPPQGTVFSIR